MEAVLITLSAAVIASGVMFSMMYALIWEGFAHGDTIRALGKEVTDEPKRFFTVGMILYLAVGLALSWLYFISLRFFQFDSIIVSIAFGGAMGFTQGFLAVHFYVAEVGLHHPFAQFNQHWLPLPFAHWFSHMVFGASLGSMLGAYLNYGGEGFLIGVLLNLLAAGGICLFANKNRLVDRWHKQHAPHP